MRALADYRAAVSAYLGWPETAERTERLDHAQIVIVCLAIARERAGVARELLGKDMPAELAVDPSEFVAP